MGRAPCCEKIGLRKGRWTREEDEVLTKYIQAHGEGSWRSLPKNAGLLRCGKSCRLRWINYLRAGLKRGNITPEEQQLILLLHSTLGSRWSLIAGYLPGRTDNEIKNYWNSHVSKRIYSITKATMTGTLGSDQPTATATSAATTVGVSNTSTAVVPPTNKTRKGRTSSPGMKKHILMSPSLKMSDNSTCLERDDEDGAQWDNLITGQTERLPVIKGHVESTEIRGSHLGKNEETDKLLGLGPYEWLDNEMMGLNEFLLQDESLNFDTGMGVLNHGTLMETDKAVVTASDWESNGERYNNTSSSSNNDNNSSSSSVNDWFDWNWMTRNDEEASDNNSSPKDSQFMLM